MLAGESRLGASGFFDRIGRLLIRDFDRTEDQAVRIRHGYAAGLTSAAFLSFLFAVRLALGLASGAVSVVAASFTLLSELLASLVLLASFWVSGRPATSRNPFGHGRMEQVAPLLISFILFFLGIEIARESAHALTAGHEETWWAPLPWILLATAAAKWLLSRFVRFLGERIRSEAVEETAGHLKVEGFYTLAAVGGLLAGHALHLGWLDGAVGAAGSGVILWLSFRNARQAIVPLLGREPPPDLLERIKAVSRGVSGVHDVHEIVVHEYGRLRVVSLHAEIPESFGPAGSHGIAEHLEEAIRGALGGDAVVHTDPLMEMTPELEAVRASLEEACRSIPGVLAFHDFRVVAHSEGRIIVVADIDVDRAMGDEERERVLADLKKAAAARVPNLAYPAFTLSSRFSY